MSLAAEAPERIAAALKRAFAMFLALPLIVVVAFLLMAVLFYQADEAWSAGHVPAGFSWLGDLLGNSQSLATLLGTVASSIITVTSITFSLLLIALQQGSSALTSQVTDQFLMRRTNQFYFGYFVGLSVFVLFSLVTASSIHRPVFGTTLALLLTAVALGMIVVMIYNTIDQMRPRQIVRTIHRYVLRARQEQLPLLERTRREARPGWVTLATLRAESSGHIVGIDLDKLASALKDAGDVELRLLVPLGRYLAFGEAIATIQAPTASASGAPGLDTLRKTALGSLLFDDGRDLAHDPSYGLGQLADIGWTSISTAKSNPDPGRAVIESLRDILSRWAADGAVAGDPSAKVVLADAAPEQAIDALETLIVAASESIQAQNLAVALDTVAMLLPGAPEPWAARLADVTARMLSSLGEHVLTRDLEQSLDGLARALAARGYASHAEAVGSATRLLRTSLGVLNSRSTRVPASG